MKTVILCGGKGTRIRDVSDEIPKPMIPIGDQPIVQHIMETYSAYGHTEFILCLGYKGWVIKEYFLNFFAAAGDIEVNLGASHEIKYLNPVALDWTVTLAETGLETMTGGRIARVEKYLEGEPFMLTYGDGVGNIDVGALLTFHRSHGRLATVTSVRPPSRFGELVVDGEQVKRFDEKPQAGTGHINGGFFVLEPGIFEYLDKREECVFEQAPLRKLASDGELMTYYHDGFWMPMDSIREHRLLNRLWREGHAPWHDNTPNNQTAPNNDK